jgi:hypothetical protein
MTKFRESANALANAFWYGIRLIFSFFISKIYRNIVA